MRTMHSVLKHGALYWDQNVLPGPSYEERFTRIQAAVAASGDDAWLVVGDVMRYGDVAFVTNFMPRVRMALAFVPRDGDPVLLANIGLRDVPAARTITWVDDVRAFGRLPKELIGLIEEKGLQQGRLGTCGFGHALFEADWSDIVKGLPNAHWQSRDAEMMVLRAVKEGWETSAIRRSARIADDAFSLAEESIRPGATVREAIAAVDKEVRLLGAEDARFMIASGPQAGQALRPIDGRRLESGDVLMVYLAVQAQRYWAETARTFVMGAANDTVKGLYAKAEDTLAAMCDAAMACAGAASVAKAAGDAIADQAMAEKAAGYGWGNGIGLDAEEPPLFAPGTEAKIADGATLALRAVLHGAGTGAICAQTVIVREGGVEPINRPAGLIEIAG